MLLGTKVFGKYDKKLPQKKSLLQSKENVKDFQVSQLTIKKGEFSTRNINKNNINGSY